MSTPKKSPSLKVITNADEAPASVPAPATDTENANNEEGADSAPHLVDPYRDPIWSEPDPFWTMDPAAVRSEHLSGVAARRENSDPARVRDAIALGRLRTWVVKKGSGKAMWMTSATGYSERRLQDFRNIADALDGLTPGVTVPRVVAPQAGTLSEPPEHWLAGGVDAALLEVRDLTAKVKKASNEAANKVALAAFEAKSDEEKAEIRRNVVKATVGKDSWNEDAVEVADALNRCPDIVDEVVDALVGLIDRGLSTLDADARYEALRRAHRALGVKLKEAKAVISTPKIETNDTDDVIEGGAK